MFLTSGMIQIDPSNKSKVEKDLTIINPKYVKRKRMNKWLGSTEKYISLYCDLGEKGLFVPFGYAYSQGDSNVEKLRIDDYSDFYDYQVTALKEMTKYNAGILVAPTGSGKTVMGLKLANACVSGGVLWIVHTKDLLNQAISTSKQKMFDFYNYGTITEGKIKISGVITFATIQTLAKIDCSELTNFFDMIIVDECHHIYGSPTNITMYSQVLNTLKTKYRFGLTATPKREDSVIPMLALIGPIRHEIKEEDVANKTIIPYLMLIKNNSQLTVDERAWHKTDGTIDYSQLITNIAKDELRNKLIINTIMDNGVKSGLVLSASVDHLNTLYEKLPSHLKKLAVIVTGKTKKLERERSLNDMKAGVKRLLFATYQLAKEGLDIPRLARLYLTIPVANEITLTQAIGRIRRKSEDKEESIIYDFIDVNNDYLLHQLGRRRRVYKRLQIKEIQQ